MKLIYKLEIFQMNKLMKQKIMIKIKLKNKTMETMMMEKN